MMATVEMSIRSKTAATTDVGAIWKAAIDRYEEITMEKIETLAGAKNVDEILDEIHERHTKLKGHRHNGSKLDNFRSLVSRSLGSIEKLSNIVASASSTSFPPSTAIFTAVSYLIRAANSVSADYDRIAGLFEDLDLYLNRLKILEKWVPPELEVALTNVLTSVLVLCGICAKYIKMKRLGKALRTLVSGEDDDLSAAYAHFHKMVEQEQGAVRSATLVATGQLQKKSTDIHADVREGLAITKSTDMNTKTLMASMESLRTYQEGVDAALKLDILARLSLLDFKKKQKDMFAKHHQGTGQWLLKHDEFQRWFKGEQPSILWCPGIPGAGKTVMTSLAVNRVYEAIQGTKAAIAYIYCDYNNPETYRELELLSSITRQLTEQTSPMPLAVKEFCDKIAEKRSHPTGDEWISLVKSICLLFQTTYIFVDALDECPETSRENFLYLIRKLEPFVRLFITSRPHVDLKAKFTNISQIDISASATDIETYLEYKINANNRLSPFTARDIKLKEDIVKIVSGKANGMFLLAHLQMDYLCRQTNPKMVRKTMNDLPTEIFAFYEEAMNRIKSQPEEDIQLARRALSYIFCARRPLNVKELLHILAVEAGDTELDPMACSETEILLNISAGLVTIDKSGTVGLAHYTLQEFLEKNRKELLPDPEVEIGKACLTYLSFDVFGRGPCSDGEELHRRLQEYQFLDYASHNWGFHVMENQLHKGVQLLLTFLEDKQKLSSFVQILHVASRRINNWHDRFPKQFGPLHVVAYWGLDKILIILFAKDIDIDSQDSYGATALQLAAKHGHKSVAQLLLDKGANVNTRNKNGETALYWAARNGYKMIVELLLVNGANVLAEDNEGWSALDWAVLGGSNDIVMMLLESGADITGKDRRQKAAYLAAEEGHELVLQTLLDSGANINAQDPLGSTAMDWAVPSGNEKAVQVLLRNGADFKSKDLYGNTALHWAAPHEKIVRQLLEYGVDVDAKNNNGQTALCWVAQDGPVTVAELLLKNNAEVNAKDKYGFTVLHRATLRGREAMARLLLENGANPNLKDKDGWTPLHLAALKRHEGLVQVLLDRVDDGKAILDWMALQLKDIKKQALLEEAAEQKAEASTALTGLRSAIQERQLDRSRRLLDKGADVNGKDIAGWTALIIAAGWGYKETMQLLLENGADVNISGPDERTALHWAAYLGNGEAVQLLVENGANVDASAFGWTAILLAVKDVLYTDIVQFLIENGANVNAEDYHGRTALHWAAKHGSRRIVRLLVDKGANFNAVDRWGRTALIWAVKERQQSVAKLLLKIGADFEVKARHNLTALHMAAFLGCKSVVQQLLKRGADVEVEAQWSGAEDGEESKSGAVDTAQKSLSNLLCQGCEASDGEEDENGALFAAKSLSDLRQWCEAEEGEEFENGAVDMTEKSLVDLLQQRFFEQGTGTDVGAEERRGLTARQLAARGGHVAVQRLL